MGNPRKQEAIFSTHSNTVQFSHLICLPVECCQDICAKTICRVWWIWL